MSIKKLNLPFDNSAIFSKEPGFNCLSLINRSFLDNLFSGGLSKFNKSTISDGLLFSGVAERVTHLTLGSLSNTD